MSTSSSLPPSSPSFPTTLGLSLSSTSHCQGAQVIEQYDLCHVNESNGALELCVRVLSYGCILANVWMPDRHGHIQDIVKGYDQPFQWTTGTPWFNSIIGRYANRINRGKFELNGKTVQLACDGKPYHLHGGTDGLNSKYFKSRSFTDRDAAGQITSVGVEFFYISPHDENGYPGELHVWMTYRLNRTNQLEMEFKAKLHKENSPAHVHSTIVNLCNHAYWNLNGTKDSLILDHLLELNAPFYTPFDDEVITTGEIIAVKDSPLDFYHQPHTIGERIKQFQEGLHPGAYGGYDHNLVLANSPKNLTVEEQKEEERQKEEAHKTGQPLLRFCAKLSHPTSGRVMLVHTTAPGVQLYTSNWLDGKSMVGKDGEAYAKYSSLCLETQNFPDAPNKAHFPSPYLHHSQEYYHRTVHTFKVEK